MLRRQLCRMGTGFLLGAALMVYGHGGYLAAVILLCFVIQILLRKHSVGKKECFRDLVGMLVFFGLGVFFGLCSQEQQAVSRVFLRETEEVLFQGELYKKEQKSDQMVYYLRDVILQSQKEQIKCSSIILYPKSDHDIIGTIYKGKAKVVTFRRGRNDGNYDERDYMESCGITAKLQLQEVYEVKVPRFSLGEKLYLLQEYMAGGYATFLPGEESGILQALALGEKASLDEEAKELYRMAGMSHILAISGLHISIVGMGIFRFLRKCRFRYCLAALLSGSVVFLYGIMTGMGDSTKRAIWMYGVYLTAQVLGENYDSLNALVLSAILLVVQNPLYMKNSGLLFSFGAVFGVVTFAALLAPELHPGKKYPLLDAFLFSAGIQLFTLPMVAYFYYEISVYGVFLNFLLVPLVGPLLGCGLVAGVLYGMPGVGIVGHVLFVGCHSILYLMTWVADQVVGLPGSSFISGKPAIWRVMVYYGILYGGLYLLKRDDISHRVRCGSFWGGVLFALLLILLPESGEEKIVMLDVGQGDGIYIQSDTGTDIFIDGGSSDVSQVGKYRILPFLKYHGVKEIDYWFVTHGDTDHTSGLLECMEMGYPVKCLVFSSLMVEDDNVSRLLELAKEQGTKVYYMSLGDTCVAGNMVLECVGPSEIWGEEEYMDINGTSLCLMLKYKGFSGLFTGDIGEEQERYLLREIEEVDLLKVAHHGSDRSSGTAFLEAVCPKMAWISCGKDNSYGHPGKEAMERLRDVVAEENIRLTMDEGQISLSLKSKKVDTKIGE